MFKRPLGLLGIFLIVIAVGYFIGAGVAWQRIGDGYDSLDAFSSAQDVQLSYDDDGNLTDRGTLEGAQAIRSLLEDEWDFPVVNGDLDPDDPTINTASEYMFQMATIVHHTLDGDQTVVLTEDDIAGAIEAGSLGPDGTYDGPVAAYQGDKLEPGAYTVAIEGRYWTGFDRQDVLDGAARDQAWSGTAHALVAELGVGAVTHSTLQLGLGIVALLAGLGVVCLAMGVAFLWHTRREIVDETSADTDGLLVADDTVPEHQPV